MASRYLAELKGVVSAVPNEGILFATLTPQEGKDSSEIQNIVTIHDAFYRARVWADALDPPAEAVQDYATAMQAAFRNARKTKIYSQELLNKLFRHPYTKGEFVEKDLAVSRLTAAKYLAQLTEKGFLQKK